MHGEKTMQKISLRRSQGLLVGIAAIVMMMLISACAGTGTSTGQSTSGTTATTTSTTPTNQVQPTTAVSQSPTAQPVAFKAGGISFIGPVKSISSSSLVMSAPNGQTYTLAITAQTDRTAFGGSLPTVGA